MRTRTLLRTLTTATGAAAIVAATVAGALALWLRPGPVATALIAGGAALLAGLVARALLRRSIVAAVDAMRPAAIAIAAGEHARRVPDPSIADLAPLATAINQLAEAVAAQQGELRRAEKLASVGRLAAGIAHEVGNPLGAINAYVHILGSRLTAAGAPADAHQALAGIEREVARIDRISRGILDYARPRTPASVPIDVNDTLHATIQLLRDQGVLRRTVVEESLGPGVPRIYGQTHDLEQLFVNLLLNAVDAMPGGGRVVVHTEVVPRAALEEGVVRRAGDPPLAIQPRRPNPRVAAWIERVRPPAEVVKVVVADAGRGIPEAERDRIFEPFVTTKAPGHGTGLGLAIASSIVDSLHGAIWVETAREGGAAFHMLFPVAVPRA